MNREGLTLLRAVIERNVKLKDAVKRGQCDIIAADLNGWMPPDMQITPVDVAQALKGHPEFPVPQHNAGVLRKRIDGVPALFSARISCALRGEAGIGGLQAIVNELNLSPDPKEHVTLADVEAAMGLAAVPIPENVVAGAAKMVGTSKLGR